MTKRNEDPAERKERSEVCKSWISSYGHEFRIAQGCGKVLGRLQGARSRDSNYGSTVSRCAWQLSEVVKKPGAVDGIATIASCVRRGFSHGVTQSTWKPKRKTQKARRG